MIACGSSGGDALSVSLSVSPACGGEAARDGGTAAAAISLSMRALSIPRLTLRLCRVSAERFAPNVECVLLSGGTLLLPLRCVRDARRRSSG
jgi:hypothetical protein